MFRVKEIARRLDCSISTVYGLLESGALPSIKIGANGGGIRVLESDLETFIESRRTRRAARVRTQNLPLKHLR